VITSLDSPNKDSSIFIIFWEEIVNVFLDVKIDLISRIVEVKLWRCVIIMLARLMDDSDCIEEWFTTFNILIYRLLNY
jgi:hypothetical protein